MTEYRVRPAGESFGGEAFVPGSKSITNRALLLACMAEGTSVIDNVLFSDDSRAFMQCVKDLGFQADVDEAGRQVTITGGRPKDGTHIYVNSAGTAARFLTAYLGTQDCRVYVDASEQMRKRPMKPLTDALETAGVRFEFQGERGFLPYWINGSSRNVRRIMIDGSLSSQFVSALLMAGSQYEEGLAIEITGEQTAKSYIDITLRMIREFGGEAVCQDRTYVIPKGSAYQARHYTVEPDISAACYFMAAAVITGKSIYMKHVSRNSMQGDIKFLSVMERLGASVMEDESGMTVTGPAGGRYPGIDLDMNDFSDQVMTMAAVAVYADGPTTIRNIGHIRHQESDRIHAVKTELTRLGIRCEEVGDGIRIEPGTPKPAAVETYDDHRMAMAFALIGLKTEGIRILNPACTKKTFENYFEVLESLYRD